MRSALLGGLVAWLLVMSIARGDDPGQPPAEPGTAPPPEGKTPAAPVLSTLQEALERNAQELKALKEEHARELEQQRKRAELQQRQIEVLERTTRLLADELKKQTSSAAAVGGLQTKTAVLEARSKQAARRDSELAGATDELRERVDTIQRNGAPLPYTVRELFLPTQTNETPLAIYGQLLGGYSKQSGRTGFFQSPSLGPWFLLQLNNRFLLEANFDITPNAISLGQGQLDWYLNNAMTLVAGRFLTPIGTFNERLSPEWINKLPDIPIMFRQVVPLTSTDGVQLRGSRYLGPFPVKLEYSLYGGNGFQLVQRPTTLTPVADLQGITAGPDANTSKAYGGRLGMWIPLYAVNFGFSGYTNGIYSSGSQNHYMLWDFDFNYHRGNWDFRTEFANNSQGATSFINHNINRRGLYTQIAYRNYTAPNRYLANLEGVFRYGFADFHGITAKHLDQTVFATPFDIPVSRNQFTFGINYYFYPSMVLKFAYEINRERGLHLNDDIFLAQGVWAF
jgi:hypothetical protein